MNNNNNNTSICKAHNVSIRAESEAIKADVVDPVGLYAYWSSIWSEGRAGSRYLRTISRSVTRNIIDVTDIGLR